MAFFESETGTNYFNCFYKISDGNLVTGVFYEMPAKKARQLRAIYRTTACLVIISFFVELFFPTILSKIGADERNAVLAVFFIFDSIIVLPMGLFLVRQKKITLEKKRLLLSKSASAAVYACVIFIPLNYTLVMIWKACFDIPSPLLPFAVAIVVLSIAGASFRLRQILTMP